MCSAEEMRSLTPEHPLSQDHTAELLFPDSAIKATLPQPFLSQNAQPCAAETPHLHYTEVQMIFI